MIINNVEIEEVNIYDADVMENIEKALNTVILKANNIKDLNTSEAMRVQCNAVFECFNTIFGDGTDKKIFGDKTNLLECLSAFEELVNNINLQKEKINNLANKYNPKRLKRK